jgi:outer membrane protein assembly factor BamE
MRKSFGPHPFMTDYQSFRISSALGLALVVGASFSLTGCANPFASLDLSGGVLYKPEIVQGNFVSSEQRNALKLGMPRTQVKDMLGTPLMASVFHADRWDYVFSIRRQGVAPQSFKLSLQFKDDVLSEIDSDDLPSENEFVTRLVGEKKTLQPPLLQASEEDLRKYPTSNSGNSLPPASKATLPTSYPPLEPAGR